MRVLPVRGAGRPGRVRGRGVRHRQQRRRGAHDARQVVPVRGGRAQPVPGRAGLLRLLHGRSVPASGRRRGEHAAGRVRAARVRPDVRGAHTGPQPAVGQDAQADHGNARVRVSDRVGGG